MKSNIAIITGIMVLILTGVSFAQTHEKQEMMGDKNSMMSGGMMGGKGMMGMMGMCHSMMNKPSIVGVSDGVVVLSGKKIYKYDTNLNLVKEAEIKIDEMPMGMMGDGMSAPESSLNKAVNADEHAAHHPKQ